MELHFRDDTIFAAERRLEALNAKEQKLENSQRLMSEEIKYLFGYVAHVRSTSLSEKTKQNNYNTTKQQQ